MVWWLSTELNFEFGVTAGCLSLLVEVVTLVPTWTGLGSAKGNSASMGTTQGDMVVPKFFPKKGPRGTYSHAWMSLAENEHTSDNIHFLTGYGSVMANSFCQTVTGSPKSLALQKKRDLNYQESKQHLHKTFILLIGTNLNVYRAKAMLQYCKIALFQVEVLH